MRTHGGGGACLIAMMRFDAPCPTRCRLIGSTASPYALKLRAIRANRDGEVSEVFAALWAKICRASGSWRFTPESAYF